MKETKKIVREAGTLIIAAFVVGLATNAVNKNGVTLTRVYYLPENSSGSPKPPTTVPVIPSNGSDETTDEVAPSEFEMINTEQAVEWFNDPNQEEYQYVWVDARKADLYEEGHIQGAYPLPHFRVEQYIDAVMPLLLTAQKVIVYCEGGDCEDSLLLARHLLTKAGLPWEKLYIYKDGLEGWQAQGYPIAEGDEP